ncbi:MAG: hypothetical protein JWN47_2602 [Frankiales bacterium]|nr:hypothetical protein [Frankiales bacterium]
MPQTPVTEVALPLTVSRDKTIRARELPDPDHLWRRRDPSVRWREPPPDSLPRPSQTKPKTPGNNPGSSALWRRRESNSQPLPCKGSALPIELRPLVTAYELRSLGRTGQPRSGRVASRHTSELPELFLRLTKTNAPTAAASASSFFMATPFCVPPSSSWSPRGRTNVVRCGPRRT